MMVKVLAFLALAIPFGLISFKFYGKFRDYRARVKEGREKARILNIMAQYTADYIFGKNGNVRPMKMPRTRKKFWLFGKTVIVD